ncbi:putative RNA uridine N3 methyltransferase [Halorutilales archaeon Cl-col2-1]
MRVTLLIPASLTSETESGRRKAYKVGEIARAASVFRCDEVVVFDDDPDEADEISLLLEYAVTPPYLRKHVFERREELRYAGVMPPLQIPPHTVSRSDSERSRDVSQYRQGVVSKIGSDGRVRVNCGLQHPVALRTTQDVREGERVTLRIHSREPLRAEIVDEEEVPDYWGYEVTRSSLVDWIDDTDGTVVATSRKGETVDLDEIRSTEETRKRDGDENEIGVVFGAPGRGVYSILREYYSVDQPSESFDLTVNTVPDQGTRTVRTEEAVFSSLAVLNIARVQDKTKTRRT